MAIQEVRQLDKLIISDLDEKRLESFVKQVEASKNRDYEIVKATSNDALVEESDIICTCTTSHKPVFNGEKLRPGTHVNAIGSYTLFMQEIDETTVTRADKIVTEHTEGLWEATGDILIPFDKGLITKDAVTGSLGEAIVGKIPLRGSDDEITLHESVGSGVLDIALSIFIYEKLTK